EASRQLTSTLPRQPTGAVPCLSCRPCNVGAISSNTSVIARILSMRLLDTHYGKSVVHEGRCCCCAATGTLITTIAAAMDASHTVLVTLIRRVLSTAARDGPTAYALSNPRRASTP